VTACLTSLTTAVHTLCRSHTTLLHDQHTYAKPVTMSKRTQSKLSPFPISLRAVLTHDLEVGITGKYGTRYGASLRKGIKRMEISQHARYTCSFCGKNNVRRNAVGIWECKGSGCHKTVAGGAYTLSYVFQLTRGIDVANLALGPLPLPPCARLLAV
jgi:large subunit ribosomal protein L37Ae